MDCTTEKSWFDSQTIDHPISNSLSTGTVSPPVKRPELEVDHSLPSRPKVRNEWSCTFTNPNAFMAFSETLLPYMAV